MYTVVERVLQLVYTAGERQGLQLVYTAGERQGLQLVCAVVDGRITVSFFITV